MARGAVKGKRTNTVASGQPPPPPAHAIEGPTSPACLGLLVSTLAPFGMSSARRWTRVRLCPHITGRGDRSLRVLLPGTGEHQRVGTGSEQCRSRALSDNRAGQVKTHVVGEEAHCESQILPGAHLRGQKGGFNSCGQGGYWRLEKCLGGARSGGYKRLVAVGGGQWRLERNKLSAEGPPLPPPPPSPLHLRIQAFLVSGGARTTAKGGITGGQPVYCTHCTCPSSCTAQQPEAGPIHFSGRAQDPVALLEGLVPPPGTCLSGGGRGGGEGVQGGGVPPPLPEHTQSTVNKKFIGE